MDRRGFPIKKLILALLSLPRSLLICLKLFGIRGWKLPILIANTVKTVELPKGSIEIVNPCRFGIRIGFGGSDGVAEGPGSLIVRGNGRIVFQGKTGIGAGSSLRVEGGTLKLGANFSCNKNCFISCAERITIGNDVLVGWNVNIRDGDGHSILSQGQAGTSKKPVTIGGHVWIAAYADILKGVHIPDGCVVAYRSCVTKPFTEKNTLIAGYPAKAVRHDIQWNY